MDGYGAIYVNDESANNFYIVCYTYVQYMLQEDVESDGNELESHDLV